MSIICCMKIYIFISTVVQKMSGHVRLKVGGKMPLP